jgi:hypothetical protein
VVVIRNSAEELLALSMLGFLRGKETNVGTVSTEFFEEFRFPDPTPAIDDNEVRTGGLHRSGECIEFFLPVVEGHT